MKIPLVIYLALFSKVSLHFFFNPYPWTIVRGYISVKNILRVFLNKKSIEESKELFFNIIDIYFEPM